MSWTTEGANGKYIFLPKDGEEIEVAILPVDPYQRPCVFDRGYKTVAKGTAGAKAIATFVAVKRGEADAQLLDCNYFVTKDLEGLQGSFEKHWIRISRVGVKTSATLGDPMTADEFMALQDVPYTDPQQMVEGDTADDDDSAPFG